jgi:hypothetical protein
VSTVSVGAAKASDWDAHFAAAARYAEIDTLVPPIEASLGVGVKVILTPPCILFLYRKSRMK